MLKMPSSSNASLMMETLMARTVLPAVASFQTLESVEDTKRDGFPLRKKKYAGTKRGGGNNTVRSACPSAHVLNLASQAHTMPM